MERSDWTPHPGDRVCLLNTSLTRQGWSFGIIAAVNVPYREACRQLDEHLHALGLELGTQAGHRTGSAADAPVLLVRPESGPYALLGVAIPCLPHQVAPAPQRQALRRGSRVAFVPGSIHHEHGLRHGVVTALDAPLSEQLKRLRERVRGTALESACGWIEPLLAKLPPHARVMVVCAEPGGLEVIAAPEWLEPSDEALAAAN